MKGSEIDDPGHLIGLQPRRFPNWGARQQPIKICPLCTYSSLRSSHSEKLTLKFARVKLCHLGILCNLM